jgi:ubiquinone/menaquinone biosynthesis C-methylase UbiE
MGGDAYGGIAKFYDRVIDPINAPLRDAAIRLAGPTESTTVLDVGCGTGSFVAAFLEAGASASGLDLSDAMLAIARERIPNGEFHTGDATAMPFDDGTFDLTCASLFLHELEPDIRDGVLREMARITAPGGRLLVIDYRIGSLRVKGWVSRTVSTVAERFAGRDHYRNWRTFMKEGGIPAAVERSGMSIDQAKIAAGGNMGIWLINP